MSNVLIALAPFLGIVIILAFFCVIISLIMIVMRGDKREFSFRGNKFFYFSLASLVTGVLVFKILTLFATNEFKAILKERSALEITANTEVLQESEKTTFVRDSLKIYGSKKLAGSQPLDVIVVSLISNGIKHRYYFQRDSRDNNMYWVYLPSELIKIKIGFVNTSVLAKINRIKN